MTPKEAALAALDRALVLAINTEKVTPLDVRLIGTCLAEVRDKLLAIQELRRPRKKKPAAAVTWADVDVAGPDDR